MAETDQMKTCYLWDTTCGPFLQLLWCPLVAMAPSLSSAGFSYKEQCSKDPSELRCMKWKYWSMKGFVI